MFFSYIKLTRKMLQNLLLIFKKIEMMREETQLSQDHSRREGRLRA